MAELSTQDREQLRDRRFADIDRSGKRYLPIHDESHIRNAIARFDQTDFESAAAKERARKRVVGAARKHGIEVDPADDVATRASQADPSASRSPMPGSAALELRERTSVLLAESVDILGSRLRLRGAGARGIQPVLGLAPLGQHPRQGPRR